MEHRSIIEQGNHVELLAAGGAYNNLYNAQFPVPSRTTLNIGRICTTQN